MTRRLIVVLQLALVCAPARAEEGPAIPWSSLELTLNLKKEYRLSVLQPETIMIGERRVDCSKFKLTGGGIRPVYYWVTSDGVLQRLVMDDRKVLELMPDGKDGNADRR